MDQSVHMSQFMQRLFRKSLLKKIGIALQTVSFVLESMVGDNANAPVELGFAKHKREDRDTEIFTHDGEKESVLIDRFEQCMEPVVQVHDNL